MTRSGTDPVAYKAERDGILMARRAPSLINMGDTLAVIADVVERLEA